MTYYPKYSTNFIINGHTFNQVSISEKDVSYLEIKHPILADNGVEFTVKMDNFFKPIIGSNLTMSIVNTSDNFFAYDDLMTATPDQFKVAFIQIDLSTFVQTTLFEGFLSSDTVTQRYLNNSTLRLTASNNFAKLSNINVVPTGGTGKKQLGDIVNTALTYTGVILGHMKVNILTKPVDASGGLLLTTPLHSVMVDTEVFMKDNIESESEKNKIEQVLLPLGSYIYQWNYNWYIERWKNLANVSGSKAYNLIPIPYWTSDPSTRSEPDVTINEPDLSIALSTIEFLNGTQEMSCIPGANMIEIDLLDKPFLNLIKNDFSDYIKVNTSYTTSTPTQRKWTVFSDSTWEFPGYNVIGVDVSKGFQFTPVTSFGIQAGVVIGNTYKSMANAIHRYGIPHKVTDDKHRAHISTSFPLTIQEKNTVLNVKWKYSNPLAGGQANAQWDHRVYYYLRFKGGNRSLYHNQAADPPYWVIQDSVTTKNYFELNFDKFSDETLVAQIDINIPLSDVSALVTGSWDYTGDQELIFGILGEDMKQTTQTVWDTDLYPQFAYYGDPEITITGDLGPNNLRGYLGNITGIPPSALIKEGVSLNLFDTTTLNYRNGFYDYPYGKKISTWVDYTDWPVLPAMDLAKILMSDLYTTYNKTRRVIKGDIKYVGLLKPFTHFVDDIDPSIRDYVLSSYTYWPVKNQYNIELIEFSREQINLIV